ncbi:MAG TPA: alpha-ketoacid dehydrogenase subunit beta [Candidatus Polarisedimenticolia bacterium]|nr:alpha-ketoacid dehydrogenase subunit beta [Candidatus Polarisedimenticolia bacterium]
MAEPITYLEAIRQGLWEEMERDRRVFMLGEDIGVYGGAFKVTKGFLEKFGKERIIDTPIAESGIVGAAIGASLMGLRPVAEMQFIDFIACAFNQITNFAAKSRWRYGAGVPIVIRGPAGGGVRGGPFHSQNPEMYFVHTPGLKVVAPGTTYDAKGMIKAAVRDEDPVIYLEHKYLYRLPRIKEVLPEEDYTVPIGKAAVRREGTDISLITYGSMQLHCLDAAEALDKEGVSAEVIDLRTLLPLDADAIEATAKKTGKVLIVHEDTRTGGIAGEVTSLINERAFEYLDGPVLRVTSPDAPVPYSAALEDFFLPNTQKVMDAARKLAAY